MFESYAMQVIVALSLVTSLFGAGCVLRKLRIEELRAGLRNFMAVGALCAMPFGFVGAVACIKASTMTHLLYPLAGVLLLIGVCALVHIYLDLFDRVNILKQS